MDAEKRKALEAAGWRFGDADDFLGQTSEQKFPPRWDEARVRRVIAHYENQSEDEQVAEIEAAREAEGVTWMAVPTELVPEVRALIARKQKS
jgi:hypothetical protein